MALLPSETLATMEVMVARAMGALVAEGTVTSGVGSTGFTASGLSVFASADALKGCELIWKSGTGFVANNNRLISASTTAGVLTVPTAWGTNPAADDTFAIIDARIVDKALLDLAIKYAVESAQPWHLLRWEDVASIVLGSITANGGFEDWTSGTSVAPDSWTLVQGDTTAAIAREGTLILPPFRYGAKVTNQASQYAAIQQQNAALVYPWDLVGGENLKVSSWVYCTTATRARLRLYDGTTTTNSGYHGGTGWEKLSIAATTIAASPSELTLQGRIETGTAISAYFHDFRAVPSGISIYEHYLPKKFVRIAHLWRENGTNFQWDVEMPQSIWSVDSSRERIVMNPTLWTPSGEYRVRIVGNSYQAVPSALGDAIELPAAYIIAAARSFLLLMGRGPADMKQQAAMVHGEALRLRRQLHNQPLPSSKIVR